MTTEIVNATTSSLSSMGSFSEVGWITTIIVFCFIFLILFLIFKNFRRTIYGSIISGILLVVYKISRWIGISAQEKNYIPIKWFAYIIGFILVSWIIGTILDKMKIISKFEKNKFVCFLMSKEDYEIKKQKFPVY